VPQRGVGSLSPGRSPRCSTQVLERPHPACWMVKKVGQLATKIRQPRPHPARLDGESGCPVGPGSRSSQATFFTIHQGGWGRVELSFSTLAI
jgi:hypothetical protein